MEKRTGVVTFAGGPITLVGPEVKVGQQAPDFTVLSNDLQPKTLKDFEGKVKVISVVPSLDTGVCDAQTRWFNQDATSLSEDVVVLTVSMDLPFAQKRWCGAAGVLCGGLYRPFATVQDGGRAVVVAGRTGGVCLVHVHAGFHAGRHFAQQRVWRGPGTVQQLIADSHLCADVHPQPPADGDCRALEPGALSALSAAKPPPSP